MDTQNSDVSQPANKPQDSIQSTQPLNITQSNSVPQVKDSVVVTSKDSQKSVPASTIKDSSKAQKMQDSPASPAPNTPLSQDKKPPLKSPPVPGSERSFAPGGNKPDVGKAPPKPVEKDIHKENLKVLRDQFGEDRIREYELMEKHTTFRIGGKAEFFYEAETMSELIKVISFCREDSFLKRSENVTEEDKKRVKEQEERKAKMEPKAKSKSPFGKGASFGSRFAAKKLQKYQLPFFILGGGSNLLVSDRGIHGLTIKMKPSKVSIGGEIVEAYAGTPTALVIKETLKADLKGLEFLEGVPGTIGGAVYNNAKAFFLGDYFKKPKSVADVVYEVSVMTKEGKVLNRNVKAYEWHLTHNNISEFGDIIMVLKFKLQKGVTPEVNKYIEDYRVSRKQKPYTKYPTIGSIFRNPLNTEFSAGKLIDDCGLKGRQEGEAQIAMEHANMIVNLGRAKADDVRKLIELARQEVKKKFNIDLQ